MVELWDTFTIKNIMLVPISSLKMFTSNLFHAPYSPQSQSGEGGEGEEVNHFILRTNLSY